MNPPTESTRPADIRAGDRQALAAAFDDYRPRLARTIAFRLDPRLVGRVDPDDVLQEAYLAAEQRCQAIKGDTEHALFIWLRLIVIQTLTDIYRRHLGAQKRDAGKEVAFRRPNADMTTSVSMAAGLIGTMTSPSQAMQRIEMAERLRDALEQMDEIDREILALRHFEEMANHEIADVLGIEQKAASIRYVRALRRLKEILAKLPGLDSSRIGI